MTPEQHDSKTEGRGDVKGRSKCGAMRCDELGCFGYCDLENLSGADYRGWAKSKVDETSSTPSPQSPPEPGRGDMLAHQERMAGLAGDIFDCETRIAAQVGGTWTRLQNLYKRRSELSRLCGEEAQAADPRVTRMAAHCCVPELDEPFFVLLGRDPQAPGLVEKWAQDRAQVEPGDKAVSAFATAKFMRVWKDAHPERGLSMEAFARIASPSDLPARGAIERALENALKCFQAAFIEGLADRLGEADTEAGSLADLVRRRLLFAQDHIEEAIAALQPLSQGNGEAVKWEARNLGDGDDGDAWFILEKGAEKNPVPGFEYRPLYAAPPSQPEGVREALEALRKWKECPMCDGEPIETAPKDGTHILAWDSTTCLPPTTMHWFEDSDGSGWSLSVCDKEEDFYRTPTIWMRLPDVISIEQARKALASATSSCGPEYWQQKAAEWHSERAQGLRNIAATTREDWTDPEHFEEEDRRANHADAREHSQRAYWHEQCAEALRTSAKGGAG